MAENSQELHGKWPVVGRQIAHMAETSLGKGELHGREKKKAGFGP